MGVTVEDELHAVLAEQAFEVRRAVEVCVRRLGRVVGVERVVREGELQLRGVRGEVVEEPDVLRRPRREVGQGVIRVRRRGAPVRVAPGGVEHVEAHVAGRERIPLAAIVR